jgi:polysaccharide transporter, PST family
MRTDMRKLSSQCLRMLSVASFALYGGFFIRKAGVLVVAMAMTRYVGLAGFGTYCVALVMMEFAARLAVFGSDVLVVRAISTRESGADALLANVLGWRILSSATVYIGIVLVLVFLSPASTLKGLVVIMGLGMVFQVVADAYISLAQGHERVDLGGYVQMVCHGAGIALMLLAVFSGYGVVGVAVAYTLRAFLCLGCGIVLSRYLNHPVRPTLDVKIIAGALRKGAPIAGNRLVSVLYLGAGLILLDRFCGAEAAGRFAGPMKIFEACAALGMMTAVAAFPTVSRLRAESKQELRAVVVALLGVIAWVGLPLCIAVALNADVLLVLLFGREFSGQGLLLVVLMSAVPFSFMYVLGERLAYAAHDQKRVLVVRVIGTLLSVGVLLATVTRLEARGAAVALLAGEVAMLLMFLPKWSSYAAGVSIWRSLFPGGLVSCAALVFALLVPAWFDAAPAAVFPVAFLLGVAITLAWRQHPRV